MAKDLFSRQTSSYAKYRPTYPLELFEYIFGYVKQRNAVWDCGTGNGQAALVLANYFNKVKATDISEKQLAAAVPHPGIEYIVCPAERPTFPENMFDLVTVAQAYHWFDFPAFEKEVRRVSKPDGIIAIWGYNLITTHNATIDARINSFYLKTIGPYWDAERKYVEENYNTVPFNFPVIANKNFSIDNKWSKADLVGYLNSWSAVQHFISHNNYNPVYQLAAELDEHWREDVLQPISFPVFLKLGHIL